MMERNIIGLCLKCEIDPMTTGLEEKHFSHFAHKKVWKAITHISSQRKVADLITVTDHLDKNETTQYSELGTWLGDLSRICNEVISPASAKGHIKEIKRQWKIREVRVIGQSMAEAHENEINVNEYIKNLMSLDSTEKKYLHSFSEAADDALVEVEKIMAGESITVPTGLHDVDRLTGGLHKSDLVVVAARPAMGKTAFMLNMAAANKTGPLVFSTEQSRIQAAFRLFSIYGNVPNHKIRTGDIGNEEFGQISNAITMINESGGYIYDKSGPYMSEIEATAREVFHNHGCTAIYLDYLQRIKHENPSLPKHEQVGDVAMRLKELARELDIPVVALAQVSRKVESREDKRPGMGDIKDSGTIEQEADSIITLYRDEVYNEDTPDKGTCEVDFKKNRHGGTGMLRVKWTAPTMRFDNLATGTGF